MNFSQWTVWLANLDPIVGSEQGRTRPVIIVSATSLNRILPVVNVIPITSMKAKRRVYPNEAFLPRDSGGLSLDSIALCYQIRTLDKRRLAQRFGLIDDAGVRREIVNALRFQLAI